MTLFMAEGLFRAGQKNLDIDATVVEVHMALLRWFAAQGGILHVGIERGGIEEDARLQVCRAPGSTCISSLREAETLGVVCENDSKGCGTIMRIAPVALVAPRAQVRELAARCSALTHGHATGRLAAAAWAEMLADVIAGLALEQVARRRVKEYASLPEGQETSAAIFVALQASRDATPEIVETLGGGWVAEEALSIALYACLVATDLMHGLQVAVTHSGDSDSTGAIAGNMLAVMFPDQVDARPWVQEVECVDLIDQLALDLSQISKA